MLIKTPAIVISTLKFQDTSLICKCYTLEQGIQTYLLKGVLKQGKQNLKSSYFQPLTQIEIVATARKTTNFEFIKEVKMDYFYQNIHSNYIKNSVAFFLSEICYWVLQEQQKDTRLFNFLKYQFQFLDKAETSSNFHLKFLIDLSYFLGFFPNTTQNHLRYFDAEQGEFVSENNGHFLFDESQTNLFKTLISTHLDAIDEIKITRAERQNMLENILKYYQFHIPNFKIPKSWEVLRGLF